MLLAQAVMLWAWPWALGEISLPLWPRLCLFKTMFSTCFWFYPETVVRAVCRPCWVPGEGMTLVWDGAEAVGPGLRWVEPGDLQFSKPTCTHPILTARTGQGHRVRGAWMSLHLWVSRGRICSLSRVSARSFSSFLCWGSDKGQVAFSIDVAFLSHCRCPWVLTLRLGSMSNPNPFS